MLVHEIIEHRNTGTAATRRTVLQPASVGVRTPQWYYSVVNGSHVVVMGDRGRLVIPAEVREHLGLGVGTTLTLLEAPDGLVLFTREQLRSLVRRDLAGLDLVDELLADRRSGAAAEDA